MFPGRGGRAGGVPGRVLADGPGGMAGIFPMYPFEIPCSSFELGARAALGGGGLGPGPGPGIFPMYGLLIFDTVTFLWAQPVAGDPSPSIASPHAQAIRPPI